MITKGKFPENGVITPSDFGDKESVDGDLAKDLFKTMLQNEPEHRPTADKVLSHPFHWKVEKVLDFLSLVGTSEMNAENHPFVWDHAKRVKFYGPISPEHSENTFKSLISNLEIDSVDVIGEDWVDTVTRDAAIFEDMQRSQCTKIKSRKNSIFYLVKYIRNKIAHRSDETPDLKILFGNDEGFLNYWTGKFPKLLMHTYKNFEPKPE